MDPVAPSPDSSRRFGLLVVGLAGIVAAFAAGWWLRGARVPPGDLPGETRDDSPVVARVGDESVTLVELEERWRQLSGAEQAFHAQNGGKAHLLEELADERLLAREARRRGIDEEPAVRIGIRACADRVLTRPLLAREVRETALPESEIKAWYDAHGDQWGRPLRVQASEIVVTSGGNSGPNDDTPDATTARAKADRLHAELEAGADFAAVARKASEAPSAAYGGLLGWVQAGRLARAQESEALALQPGQMSPVVEVPEGFAIFLAMAREEATTPPLSEVRDEILATLLADDQGALQRRYQVFIDQLKAQDPVELHPERIEARPVAGSPPATTGPSAAPGR